MSRRSTTAPRRRPEDPIFFSAGEKIHANTCLLLLSKIIPGPMLAATGNCPKTFPQPDARAGGHGRSQHAAQAGRICPADIGPWQQSHAGEWAGPLPCPHPHEDTSHCPRSGNAIRITVKQTAGRNTNQPPRTRSSHCPPSPYPAAAAKPLSISPPHL